MNKFWSGVRVMTTTVMALEVLLLSIDSCQGHAEEADIMGPDLQGLLLDK
jgi:hypothetical protein